MHVSDIMQKHVVEIPLASDAATAAELFFRHQISAAPVVDYTGRCVGMLSAVDFMKVTFEANDAESELANSDSEKNDGNRTCRANRRPISAMMSAPVIATQADRSLMEAAREMHDSYIHHLPVLDPRHHPVGFISSMDIVSAVLNASGD